MKLTIEYVKNTGVDWDGLVANIGYASGTFMRLGLRKGQRELFPAEIAWLELHEPEIIAGCEAQGAMFANWKDISSDERKVRTTKYQVEANKLHKLADQFCKELKIKDS